MSLLDSFIQYVKIDTQSDESSESTPSSTNQFSLLHLLEKQLRELGLHPTLDKYGRLYAYLPGNSDYPCIGLCAHVDTASECSGKNVKPQIIVDYNGKNIKLGDSQLSLSPKEYRYLKGLLGKTIITTDGTTLLGADDKAGVAIIMETIKNVQKLKESERYPLSILFTPDEEIGRGAEHFNLKKFKAKYAYTLDGDNPHLLSVENFNAYSAIIKITGRAIHPGDAKGVMINAIMVLTSFISFLPKKMIPSLTSGHEGFNHIVNISGDVEHASASYILRNHNIHKLQQQIKDFRNAQDKCLKLYPGVQISVVFKKQYANMLDILKKNPDAKKHIEKVYKRLNLEYKYEPIRGGTDGATFSFLGCPTPNLGTGSYNHHGRYEYAVLEEMELLVKIATEIFKI